MNIRKIALYFLCLMVIVSCSKDDNSDPVAIPEQDRSEQQVIDRALLLEYLETHYYNSSTFVNNPNPSLSDIIISELPANGVLPDPTNNKLLINAVEIKNVDYPEEDGVVDYEYYILRLNQGGGVTSPHFTDKVRVNYYGNLLNEELFDSTVNPTSFDLLTLIPGWGLVVSEFNTSESFIVNGDGTVDYYNNGLGVMFLPSGLGYFSSGSAGIPVYAPLIFKFELYQTEINDHDGDGVPSYLEDLDSDFFLSNDDTDSDGFLNYLDINDDNDAKLTKDELAYNEYIVDTNIGEQEPVLASNEFVTKRTVNNGIVTIKTVVLIDSNNDGKPDYLDSTVF